MELLVDAADDLPPVHCDPHKMAWVVTNLIGNALRYTHPGGHIWLAAEKAGRWVHLYVRDNGAGIPYDKQSVIFDKFVQVGPVRPRGRRGARPGDLPRK